MFCAPNRADAGTLSGGSWEATLPLTNLQTRWLSDVARSTDAALASTKFVCDQGSAKRVRAVYLGGHNLSLAAKYLVRAYDTLAVTRADTATYVDEDGVVTAVANNILRQWHYLTDNTSTHRRVTLLERAYTNLVTSDIASWTNTTTTVTTGVADPQGGTGAVTLTATAVTSKMAFTPTYTGNATKSFSVLFRKSAANASDQSQIDLTGAAARGVITITWTGTVPTVTATTGVKLRLSSALSGAYYKVDIQAPGVVAADTNVISIFPDNLNGTGSLDVFVCPTFDDAVPPASILAASEATTADAFTVALLDATPQAATHLVEFAGLDLTNTGTDRVILDYGQGAGAAAGIRVLFNGSANQIVIAYHNGTSEVTGAWNVTPALADYFAVRWHQASTGAIDAVGLTVNAAAEDTTLDSAFGSTLALPGSWNANVTEYSGTSATANKGLISHKAQSGSEKSLAEMQALTSADIAYYNPYDSQWTDVYGVAYPATATLWGDDVGGQVISAEQFAAGEREDIIEILEADRVLRYVSLEIDDTTNADGYVEAGRLVVAPAYQTTVNMDAGATFGYETSSTREETDGGATFHNDRPRRRVTNIAFDGTVAADEALVQMLEMDRRLGTSGQFLWVFDPADTYHMHRRSYLATLKELSLLEMPYTAFNSKRYAIVEEL